MGKSTTNVLSAGYSGKTGDIVFRNFVYKMVIAKAPDCSHTRWTRNQKANRKRFSKAMAWAVKTLENPEMRRSYLKRRKRGQTIYNVAVADYMKNLRVDNIDLSGYKGRAGDTIVVKAKGAYAVNAIILTILTSQGLLVETMEEQHCGPGNNYVFRTTETNPAYKKSSIVVKVCHLPVSFTHTYRVT